MTFGFIEAEKASFPISRMCRVLEVSQSGFFAWQERSACRRQQQDMVYLAHIRTAFTLFDAAYWACIGVPLVLLTYWGVMGIPLDSASFIGLKQAVNGVLNAVVAGLIMGFLPTLAPPARRNLAKVSFDALLFHVLAFVALTTSLVLTLAESRAEYRLNLDRVSALLNALGAQTQHFSMADHYRDEEFRRALVPMLGSATGLGLEIDDIAIARARPDGSHEDVLGATRTLDVTGTATQVQPGVWRWSPTGPMPELSRLNASVYFARVAAPDVEFARDGLARVLWRAFSSLPGPFARRRWDSGSRAMNAV